MALVYTRVAAYPDKYQSIYDLTLDAAYPANGYVLDPKQLGVLSIDNLSASFVTGEGLQAVYIASTSKLKIYKSAAGATAFTEIANTDVSTSVKVRVDVSGRPIL